MADYSGMQDKAGKWVTAFLQQTQLNRFIRDGFSRDGFSDIRDSFSGIRDGYSGIYDALMIRIRLTPRLTGKNTRSATKSGE